jgi:hypothetical protein
MHDGGGEKCIPFSQKPKRKRTLGTCSHTWEDNIKKDVKEIGCEDVDWICLAPTGVQWQAFVNTAMNLCIS